MKTTDWPEDLRAIATDCDKFLTSMERLVVTANDKEAVWNARMELEGARKLQRVLMAALDKVRRGTHYDE